MSDCGEGTGPARFAFLDHPGPIPFAHRGGAAGGLENSLAAFAHAVELGYRYLETDVHATSDGVLLAFHDRTLDRVTDRVGVVAQLPWREVREARIGGREPIPTLEELLGSWPDVRVNIDVKEMGAVEPLIEVIRRTGAVDRVCVASFSARRTAAVRRRVGAASLHGDGAACRRAAPPRRHRSRSPLAWFQRLAPCAQVPDRIGPGPGRDARLLAPGPSARPARARLDHRRRRRR